jgi:hypothetical protein
MMKNPTHNKFTNAVVKVGNGGRGFVVETKHRSRIVITAAHCLTGDGRQLPPAHPYSYLEERTYQMQLQAGVKRIDLTGKEVGTVTLLEQNTARKYMAEHHRPKEKTDLIVEKVTPRLNLPISKPPPTVKEEEIVPMPKTAAKTANGALEPIQQLLNAATSVGEMQPESVRRFWSLLFYANSSTKPRKSSPLWRTNK